MNGNAPGPIGALAGYVLLAAFTLWAIPMFTWTLVSGLRSGTIRLLRWEPARARDGAAYWLVVGVYAAGLVAAFFTVFNIVRRFGLIG